MHALVEIHSLGLLRPFVPVQLIPEQVQCSPDGCGVDGLRHGYSLRAVATSSQPGVTKSLRNAITADANGAPLVAPPKYSRPRRKRTSPRMA